MDNNLDVTPQDVVVEGREDVPYNEMEFTPIEPTVEEPITEVETVEPIYTEQEEIVLEPRHSNVNVGTVAAGVIGAAAVAGAGYAAYKKLDEKEKENKEDEYVETKYYTDEDFGETSTEDNNIESKYKVVADEVEVTPAMGNTVVDVNLDKEKEQEDYYNEY